MALGKIGSGDRREFLKIVSRDTKKVEERCIPDRKEAVNCKVWDNLYVALAATTNHVVGNAEVTGGGVQYLATVSIDQSASVSDRAALH